MTAIADPARQGLHPDRAAGVRQDAAARFASVFVLMGGAGAGAAGVQPTTSSSATPADPGADRRRPCCGMLDFTHNLYSFGDCADRAVFGHERLRPFPAAQLWFQGYWGLFAAGVAAAVRGVVGARRRRRLHASACALRAAAPARAAGHGAARPRCWPSSRLGGLAVLEHQRPQRVRARRTQQLDLQARYEREYRKYKRPAAAEDRSRCTTDVDLRPEDADRCASMACYRVRNPYATADRGSARADGRRQGAGRDRHGRRQAGRSTTRSSAIASIAWTQPIAAGRRSATSASSSTSHPNGITNDARRPQIVANGTFFNSQMLPDASATTSAPQIDRPQRAPQARPGRADAHAKLEDEAARASTLPRPTTPTGSTSRPPSAPRRTRSRWRRATCRRSSRATAGAASSYTMDRPMLNFYAYLSARWQVKKASTRLDQDIPIEVYYDPKHPYNVDRMIEAVQKSLAYFEGNFTPYQHRQVRIIEFPGYAAASPRRSPTRSRIRNRSASSPTCATRTRSTTCSTSPRTRSRTSGGRTR